MKTFPLLPSTVIAAALLAGPAQGAALVVGAPVELADSIDALSRAFVAEERAVRLRFVVDSSENLYAQVAAGAPLDVYMSTHMGLQAQLLSDGHVVYDTWTMYAAGRLVLWAADRRFDVSQGVAMLSQPAVKKIAIADGGSSYLPATLQAIDAAGLTARLQPRLLPGDSMQSLVKAVESHQAQAAFLSYDTVLAPAMKGVGHYYLVPEGARHDVIGHAAIVTVHGKANPAAYRFIRFLKSARAQAILAPRGFMPPPASVDVR